MLEQVLLNDGSAQPITINSLEDLLIYVHTQSDSISTPVNDVKKVGFDSSKLLEIHNEHSCLYIDRYFDTCLPDAQTQFLIESQGLGPESYEAWLGRPGKDGVIRGKFWVNFCTWSKNQTVSEFVTPIVSGGKFNPYVRYTSSKISAQEQLKKCTDLAGSDILAVDKGPPLYNLIIFTFPKDISFELLTRNRVSTIAKAWKCFKLLQKELRFLFGVDVESIIGSNVSLHKWVSEFPFIPHLHFHVVFPHFSYCRITAENRISLEEHPEMSAGFDALYAADYDQRDSLHLQLSNKLKKELQFSQLSRFGPKQKNGFNLPLDIDLIKHCWTEIVNEVFELDTASNYDVYTEFCRADNKRKLYHNLRYKNRPPILDLDLFFKKCPGFVNGFHGKDLKSSAAVEYVRTCFINAVLRDDVFSAAKYESLLNTAEKLVVNFTANDIYEWLQYLSTCKSETKTFGFWRNIKRYRVTSVIRGELKTFPVCPICGGDVQKAVQVNKLFIDYLIVQDRNKFTICKLNKGPPDITPKPDISPEGRYIIYSNYEEVYSTDSIFWASFFGSD